MHRSTADGRLEGLPALTVVFAFLDATALIRFKRTARFAATAVNEKAAVVIHQRLQSHLWCTGFYGDNADLWLLADYKFFCDRNTARARRETLTILGGHVSYEEPLAQEISLVTAITIRDGKYFDGLNSKYGQIRRLRDAPAVAPNPTANKLYIFGGATDSDSDEVTNVISLFEVCDGTPPYQIQDVGRMACPRTFHTCAFLPHLAKYAILGGATSAYQVSLT